MVNTQSMSDATLATPSASLSSAAPDSGGRIHRVAGKVHQAIDRLEHTLSAKGGSALAAQGRYGDQARRYGEDLRGRIDERPLQAVGIALASGIVASKLLLRSPKPTRVVQFRVPAPQRPESAPMQVHGRRWNDAGQHTAGRMGAAAALGVERTRAMASSLAQSASNWPMQLRLAAQRMLGASQAYGSMARSSLQAHPMAGAGAALGAAALATTLWWQRREPARGMAYVAVNEKGHGVAWQRAPMEMGTRARDLVTARPVASAAVVLGLGVLAAALMRRR